MLGLVGGGGELALWISYDKIKDIDYIEHLIFVSNMERGDYRLDNENWTNTNCIQLCEAIQ